MTFADTLTPSQAARAIGCSTELVRYRMAKGYLPFVATPLGRLIEKDALERCMAERPKLRRRAEVA